MYKTAVRALVRHGIARLNAGDASFLLRLASPDVELTFPGDNDLARMYRPVEKGPEPHPTHRGIAECRGFAERIIRDRLRIHVDDVLVNGPPWRTRVAVRSRSTITAVDGDEYHNRLLAFLEIRWGRLVRWEDYEDTERITAWYVRHPPLVTS